MDIETFNCDLLDFLAASPTPFHAVQQMEIRLSQAGFVVLREADDWTLDAGGRYCVIRNSSSIVAFTLGEKSILDQGL